MDRRAFIWAMTGSLLAAPLAAEAQDTRTYRIGFLSFNRPPPDPIPPVYPFSAFCQQICAWSSPGAPPAVAAVVISRQASRPLIAPLLPVLCPLLLPLSLANALPHLAVRVAHPLLSGLVLEFPEDRLVPLPIPGIPGLTVIVPVELTLPPLMGPDGIFESEGLGARAGITAAAEMVSRLPSGAR